MADAILFLCREGNLADPFKALESPLSHILPKGSPIVRHLEPNSSLLDAIDCILEGTQNLVIPIQNHYTNSRKNFPNRQPPASTCTRHNGHKYCWLTQEDVVRFLLNSLGAFSPIPTFTIDSLNITDHDIMTITYNEPASSALPYFRRALTEQTSIAVVDEQNRLIGEISPFALSCSNETAAGAIMALSAVDLMTYIECGRPPEDLVQLVKTRLRERNLVGMVEMIDEFLHTPAFSSSSSCSSDDESGSIGLRGGSGRKYSTRRSEAIVCGPRSSLVAVMIQALAHRVSCVWVVDEGYSVVGAVTFAGILKVFGNVAGVREA
ncbi:CBS domain-containing protein cbsx5 [Phtheirospermum japonicum]|uniref:CBS domain-containing protein cbsx5 n=1 Tax=Phtheirospermum japonicum TaxID=374723 RepID=A0A830DAI9_9LAMI|nr:CBS domain-containing protein cbsx5 [Phtheirospermum japonicum]